MKKLLMCLVFCSLLVWAVPAAQAQAQVPPPPGEVGVTLQALQLLSFGQCQIMQLPGEAKVYLDGFTSTQFPTDYVGLRIYLQRWDGAHWNDLTTYLYEGSNTDYVDGGFYYPVVRGYYYRAKGIHMARNGDITENMSSYSSSIMIE